MGSDVHVQLLVRDLSGGAFARYEPQQSQYHISTCAVAFKRVRVLGVCTKVARSGQSHRLELDDGTGAIAVQMHTSQLLFDAQELRCGEMIDCLGELMEPSGHSSVANRWISATHILLVADRNMESLRMLEILQLYRQVYCNPATRNHRPLEKSVSPITLLAFPPPPANVGVKRKHYASSPPTHDTTSTAINTAQPPATLIEKPTRDPKLINRHPAPPPIAVSLGATTAVPAQQSVLPAAEYRFNVTAVDHQHIENGTKTLEIRLNVPPYSIIRVNDRIIMNGHTTAVVHAVRKYTHLKSVLQMEPLAQLLPSAGSSSSGTLNAIAAATRHFRQFFSAQEEENHGFVVFELRVGSNASSATENKKSPEEWSQLLYEQLSKKRTYGCSLADLQFAFPALPVEQIMEILTDLQMDGVVYNVQDKYLLL